MAEFYVALSTKEIASQIASLINKYSLWYTEHTANRICAIPAYYFVELICSRVIGCASILQTCSTLSKIQHICVVPEFRGMKIATKLSNLAIGACNTEYIHMTIREDNIPSLNLARALNFTYIKKYWFRDHNTIIVGRRKIL